MNQPVGAGQHWVIGFHWKIDRFSIKALLAAVGAAIDSQATGITIAMSSEGGAPDQAQYAYEILRQLPTKIITHNLGYVQSAAVTLFVAGHERYAVDGSHFLMHETMATPAVPISQAVLGAAAASLKIDDAAAIAAVATRTGKSNALVAPWFQGEVLRDTAFAKTNGIIHDVRALEVPSGGRFLQTVVA